MKMHSILLAIFGLFFYTSPGVREEKIAQNSFILKSNEIRMNGVYSLYDTSKGSDEIQANDRYILIDPILFLKANNFIQSSNCRWISNDIADELRNKNQKFDFGKYHLNGSEIVLEGNFTFYTRGMQPKHFKARYVGFFNSSWDTLSLKLGEPYPPVNMKFNKRLVQRLKSGDFQQYVFKPIAHSKIDIEESVINSMKQR